MCGGIYEDEFVMDCGLNIGDRVVGIYGAMFPHKEGKIVGLEMLPQGLVVDVEFEDGIQEMMEYNIRSEKALERALMGTQVGSPIGVYLANDLELV
jgi:hypothetical protein